MPVTYLGKFRGEDDAEDHGLSARNVIYTELFKYVGKNIYNKAHTCVVTFSFVLRGGQHRLKLLNEMETYRESFHNNLMHGTSLN